MIQIALLCDSYFSYLGDFCKKPGKPRKRKVIELSRTRISSLYQFIIFITNIVLQELQGAFQWILAVFGIFQSLGVICLSCHPFKSSC